MTKEKAILVFAGGAVSSVIGLGTIRFSIKTPVNDKKINGIILWSGVAISIGGLVTMFVAGKSLPATTDYYGD